MYIRNNLGSFGGLNSFWGGEGDAKEVVKEVEEEKDRLVDPKTYIPKKSVHMGADAASQYLKSLNETRQNTRANVKGGVYWASTGPTFSEKSIKGASQAELVPKPQIKFNPNIKIVRDLPKVDLPPVEDTLPKPEAAVSASNVPGAPVAIPPSLLPSAPTGVSGFGETFKKSTIILFVLGLIIVGILSYNSK